VAGDKWLYLWTHNAGGVWGSSESGWQNTSQSLGVIWVWLAKYISCCDKKLTTCEVYCHILYLNLIHLREKDRKSHLEASNVTVSSPVGLSVLSHLNCSWICSPRREGVQLKEQPGSIHRVHHTDSTKVAIRPGIEPTTSRSRGRHHHCTTVLSFRQGRLCVTSPRGAGFVKTLVM
jgi:hypothetical protein